MLSQKVADGGGGGIIFTLAPLMHGAGRGHDDPQRHPGRHRRADAEVRRRADVARRSSAEKVNVLGITGDAMARPLADTLEEMHDDVDLSSLFSIGSSARDLLASRQGPVDGAAAEHRGHRLRRRDRDRHERHQGRDEGREAARRPGDRAAVARLDRARRRPRAARRPAPARSAGSPAPATSRSATTRTRRRRRATFVEHDGKRYSIPGDFATVEADGQITLLGRGSIVINSGGEKIFPEEVEGVLKAHPDVFDVLVVGVPDERWGERVAAVVQARDGQGADARGPRRALPDRRSPATRRRAGVPRRRDPPRAERQARLPVGEGVRAGRRRRRVTHVGSAAVDAADFEAAGLYDPDAPDAPDRLGAARAPRRAGRVDRGDARRADAVGSLHAAASDIAVRPGERRTIERGRRRRRAQRRPAPAGGGGGRAADPRTTTTATPTSRPFGFSPSVPSCSATSRRCGSPRAMGSSLGRVADAAISLFLVVGRGSDAARQGDQVDAAAKATESASRRRWSRSRT